MVTLSTQFHNAYTLQSQAGGEEGGKHRLLDPLDLPLHAAMCNSSVGHPFSHKEIVMQPGAVYPSRKPTMHQTEIALNYEGKGRPSS